MFATIVRMGTMSVRSSFHATLDGAIDYARDNPGVDAIEHIGKGEVWCRADCEDGRISRLIQPLEVTK